jgi:hypothetical protein
MKDIYLSLLNDFDKLSDYVDSLSHADRIELRESLVSVECDKLARSLFYDYDKQCWI